MSAKPESIHVTISPEPCIIVAHGWGVEPHLFTDGYKGDAHDDLREQPIRRAVTVARLRALADQIEGGEA